MPQPSSPSANLSEQSLPPTLTQFSEASSAIFCICSSCYLARPFFSHLENSYSSFMAPAPMPLFWEASLDPPLLRWTLCSSFWALPSVYICLP